MLFQLVKNSYPVIKVFISGAELSTCIMSSDTQNNRTTLEYKAVGTGVRCLVLGPDCLGSQFHYVPAL